MASSFLLALISFHIGNTFSLAFTTPVGNPDNLNGPMRLPSNLTLHLNELSSATKFSAAPTIRCDGATYQRNLDRTSCLDAYSIIDNDDEQRSIGMRASPGFGPTHFEIDLPYRWISCKSPMNNLPGSEDAHFAHRGYVADGKCIFDIVQSSHTRESHASMEQFKRAAFLLRNRCLGSDGTDGGIAVMGKFQPQPMFRYQAGLRLTMRHPYP